MVCESIRVPLHTQARPFMTQRDMWVTGIAFVAGWIFFRTIGAGIALAVVGVLVSWCVGRVKRFNEVIAAVESDLQIRGYKIDFKFRNHLVIDSNARVIAFLDISHAKASYDLYKLSDILSVEHQWVDKTTATTNPFGVTTANTRQADNTLAFKTNNPAKPLYKVSGFSHKGGELWLARLNAMLNT